MGFAGEGVGETWLIVVAGGEFDKRRWIPAFAGTTVVVEATVVFPPSSQRKLGSSGGRERNPVILKEWQ